MTIKEVKLEVSVIRAMSDDDEAAHSKEDDLHQAVLKAIANGAENASQLASEALKTTSIRFSRWCA